MKKISLLLAMTMVLAGFRSDGSEQRAKEISEMKAEMQKYLDQLPGKFGI